MKKISILLLIIVALLGLTACGNKVESTAKSFFKALENQDFEAAKKLSTEEGQQLLTLIEGFAQSADEEQIADMKKTKYEIVETVVEGDSAVVKYRQWNTDKPEAKEDHELQMKKVEGAWKVHFVKDDVQK
ncbi:MAG: hypothetical protein WCY87_02740 [Candidatus Cloacimonadales bacterium]|jgi:ABC-type glycerol-3-phosphate transport system substrate-binding protein|nr:DUF4878 domain-containing protein [Candidatus Cloacimonadota bacterium]MDY0381340.1 DUF4878 domain-containing protein [Candidatus Cloacimonadaceae bacterium]HCM16460.1 hypothetical protein [Candidatus Cloacimonas sp.]MCB5256831.1 DUF4878 domain-containing protein [Candidatus Cloacimonadota bacterium]MCB5264325.1 DUF4878 domain-containing protein [Candidatus Cloacimonadota bacterium]